MIKYFVRGAAVLLVMQLGVSVLCQNRNQNRNQTRESRDRSKTPASPATPSRTPPSVTEQNNANRVESRNDNRPANRGAVEPERGNAGTFANSGEREPSNSNVEERLAGIEARFNGDDPYVTQSYLGPLSWLSEPIVLGLIGLLIVLALAFHLVHLIKMIGLSREVGQLAIAQRNLAHASRVSPTSGKNPALEKISEQMTQQSQGLNLLLNRVSQMEGRFTAYDSQFRDAAHALTLTANWIGQTQLREALGSEGGSISETDRAATIAMLERYEGPLRINASRVEPATQALAELVDGLEGRMQSSSELAGRVQSLYEGIGLFDDRHKSVSDELTSLRRGSFSQRRSMLQADQERLFDQVNNGSLSVAQMVQKSRALVENHFPESPKRDSHAKPSLVERESDLKRIVGEAPDYLMDWYDNLLQLQNLLAQSQRTPTEVEIATGLAKVQQAARETLGRFDIQPDAIQIGQTSYDRRLHDAALVRQTTQYPIHTIVDIHKCGFRRMTSGEVLRRPQVVVAGAATS